jgi:outer membrane protein
LTDAVQTALKYNPMVGAATYQAQAAQARVGMARAMTKPRIGVSAFAGNSSMGDIVTSPPNVTPFSVFAVPSKTGVAGSAQLMLPLYTGGLLSGTVKSAQASSTAAASDEASVKLNTALETKAAYHKALLMQAGVAVFDDLVKQAQERVRIAEEAFKEGKIAKYDFLRNQTELADAQQQLNSAQRDARIAVVELKAILGVDQNSDVTLADQLTYTPVKDGFDTYTALAMKNRPELAAVRARVQSAGSNVGVAKGAYSPQVYANAMQGTSAVSGDTQSGFTVGVTVGITLVDGGERRAAVKEAQAMLNAMKQDEKQALLGVQQDVGTAWAEAQAAERNVELSGAAVVQAEEDYRVIRLRYEAGKAVNVEVLDALTALVRAQNNRLAALYEHSIAGDKLARAVGEM